MSKTAKALLKACWRFLSIHLEASELCQPDQEHGVISQKYPLSWEQFIQSDGRHKWKEKNSAWCIMGTFYDGAPLHYRSVTMMPPESRKCSFGRPFSCGEKRGHSGVRHNPCPWGRYLSLLAKAHWCECGQHYSAWWAAEPKRQYTMRSGNIRSTKKKGP